MKSLAWFKKEGRQAKRRNVIASFVLNVINCRSEAISSWDCFGRLRSLAMTFTYYPALNHAKNLYLKPGTVGRGALDA